MTPTRPICDGLFTTDGTSPRLLGGRCTTCRALHFPAADTCPYCGDPATIEPVGPRGTLRLFTAVHTAPPGYRGPVPYGFGVVELEGTNLCVLSRLGVSDLALLHPGLPLRLDIAPLFVDDDGSSVVSWTFVPENA